MIGFIKRLIYKIKRFFHSLKVRWKIRKSLKIWAETSYWFQMAAYDMVQTLKGIRPMTGETLGRMAKLIGIERQEGETDEELRQRTMEMAKQKGARMP